MDNYQLTQDQITAYGVCLRTEEHTPSTIEKYLRDTRAFAVWLEGRPVTRELAAEWRDRLLSSGHKPSTVNSMLAAVNGLFRFLGWHPGKISEGSAPAVPGPVPGADPG